MAPAQFLTVPFYRNQYRTSCSRPNLYLLAIPKASLSLPFSDTLKISLSIATHLAKMPGAIVSLGFVTDSLHSRAHVHFANIPFLA